MKKNRLYTLTTLMTIALVGIIWIQWYWINNGIKIKEQQFDQLVNTSLNDIVSTLEDNESVVFLSKQLNNFTSDVVIESDTNSEHIVWSSNKGNDIDISKIARNHKDVTVKIETISDSIENGSHQIKTTKKVIVNNKVITEDIKTEDILGERFDNVMVKMVKEFKRRDNPIEHFVGTTNLDSLAANKLNNNGLNADFTYAILNEDSIINKFSSTNYSLTNNNYQIPLFKHDLSAKPTMLSLSFPDKKISILKSMWVMVFISILFTLIILICFSSAIYYMFKQKKLAEIKNDFINNMTHEFKTPISTISLAIDSITHPKIIEDKTQINYYADIIRKENKRMNTQVESVLNTSLAEKNELRLNFSQTAINDFLNTVKDRMELQIKNSKATFFINNNTKNVEITVDEHHLQNAICNLLDNAIKYSDKTPQINLTVEVYKGEVIFSVSDNGIGMNKETQQKVFEKFYRVQTGNIHNVKGFGIGLSYVKAIIEAHQGTINVKSKLGLGTTITINIPK